LAVGEEEQALLAVLEALVVVQDLPTQVALELLGKDSTEETLAVQQ
jgi:hypothetical protein